MYSLSRTLSVRFASTMLIGLLIVGTSLLFGAKRLLRAELDRGLQAVLELELAALRAGQPVRDIDRWNTRTTFIEHVNRFVVLRDSLGNVLAGNTPSASLLPIDIDAHSSATEGRRAWVVGEWDGEPVRSVYAPALDGGVVQVSAFMKPIEGVFTALFGIMLGAVVLTTSATAVGARWLARTATAPVAAITAQIENIGDHQGADRISVHANAEEYRELVSVLNDMLQRLRAARETQRRLIANTGHDIRTPITVMQGEIEVALRSKRTADQYRQVLVSCLEEARQMVAMSDKLLLLARIEAGAMEWKPKVTDLSQLVVRSIESLSKKAGERAIQYRGLTSGAATMADEFLVALALREVLENALLHTPPHANVTVGVVTVGDWIEVTIDDAGPGVPSDHLELLFERTHREDSARTRTGSSGLGLAIVAAVVRVHNGDLDAAPSPLGGLRVALRLPSVRPETRL